MAPRALNEPVTCRHSSFSVTRASVGGGDFSAVSGTTGVARTEPAMRSRAASMSARPIMPARRGKVGSLLASVLRSHSCCGVCKTILRTLQEDFADAAGRTVKIGLHIDPPGAATLKGGPMICLPRHRFCHRRQMIPRMMPESTNVDEISQDRGSSRWYGCESGFSAIEREFGGIRKPECSTGGEVPEEIGDLHLLCGLLRQKSSYLESHSGFRRSPGA